SLSAAQFDHSRAYQARSPGTRLREGGKLMTPRVPAFGKPVAQQKHWPATLLHKVHADVVGYDNSLSWHHRCYRGVSSQLPIRLIPTIRRRRSCMATTNRIGAAMPLLDAAIRVPTNPAE